MEHIVRDYLIARWGDETAEDIKPLDIQRWLKSLHCEKQLAWTTISKMRGVMSRIYKVGVLHERVSNNPVQHVETRSTSTYRAIVITPEQTLAILRGLPNPLHHTLVLTCAATALRASEILALRWSDILWQEARIRVSKRWARGKDGPTKTETADGYVPLHSVLAQRLPGWHADALRQRRGFRLPVAQGARPCSPLGHQFCRRSSAPSGHPCRHIDPTGPAVRASQPASQPEQLAREQGEDRAQDRPGAPASLTDSNDAGSLHAGRQR